MPLTQRQVIDYMVVQANAEAERLHSAIKLGGVVVIDSKLVQRIQVFEWEGRRWYIEAALQIIGARQPNHLIPVRYYYKQFIERRTIDVNWDHVPLVNVWQPPIVIPFRLTGTDVDTGESRTIDHDLPIDGIHRIARANQLGLSKIPAHRLSEAERDACEVVSEPDGILLGERADWRTELAALLPMLVRGDTIRVPRGPGIIDDVRFAVADYGLDPDLITIVG